MSRAVELVGVDGTRINLDAAPYELAANPALWGMPPVATPSRAMLGVEGEVEGQTRVLPRPVACPVWVRGSDTVEFDEALARLARLVNPLNGLCWLVVTRGDGTARQVAVRYSSGYEALPVRDRDRARALVPLVFMAADPFWRAADESEFDILATEFIGGGEPTLSDSPNIASDAPIPSNGFNETGFQYFQVDLSGDVEAWPRWEIAGPADQLTAVNMTTGKKWSYVQSLPTDVPFVVDTRPTVRRVVRNDVNVWADLTDDSELWPLVPGRNWIGLRVQAWDPTHSKLLLSWRERYLTC